MRAKEFITEAFDTDAYAREQAEKYGVPFSMVKHALKIETGHIADPAKRAAAQGPVTKSGERAGGYMQLMPGTAKEMGVTDRFNAKQNIQGGVRYLAKMYNKFQDPKIALAAYNHGPGNIDRWLKKGGDFSKLPKETRDYIFGNAKKKMPGYTPDEEETAQQAVAPVGLPPKAAATATKALAAVTGSKNAYGNDEIPQRKIAPVATQKFPVSQPAAKPVASVAPVAPVVPAAPVVTPSNLTIQRGDTLSGIAKSKGMSVQDIMALNPEITDPNKISAGATLKTSPDR